jgi:hypothetical protein
LNGVEYVDEDQKDSDKEGHPTRDNLREMARRSTDKKIEGSKGQKGLKMLTCQKVKWSKVNRSKGTKVRKIIRSKGQ